MKLPYRFPSEADKIFEEAQAFRRLSPDERFRQIFDLIACGLAMLEQSPQREAAERFRQQQEAEWQARLKEFFKRHGI
jgi:hypothetical protein